MSPIDVCNQALALIGDRRISRLDEEAQAADPLAGYCAEFYDISRRAVLSAARWSFAKKSAVLTRRTNVVCFGFTYAHAMPTDRIRVMALHKGVLLNGETVPTFGTTKIDRFQIVGRDVWTDCEHVGMSYIADVLDPSEWSPHFLLAMVRLLAHYLAGAVGAEPRMTSGLLQTYKTVDLPDAQFYDAIQDESGENARDNRGDSPTLKARYASGQSSYGPLDETEP